MNCFLHIKSPRVKTILDQQFKTVIFLGHENYENMVLKTSTKI